jgi:hypothetical protein
MNKSKELCKLLGIEPQIHVDLYDAESYHYPDLTKPSNFIKLLKLKISKGTYIYDSIEAIYVEDLENSIIDRLISKIELQKRDKTQIFTDLELFRDAVRATEWEY